MRMTKLYSKENLLVSFMCLDWHDCYKSSPIDL